jgi:hypothetical protein
MAQILPEASEKRILFLDNIRYLMVVFVVLLHSASSYGTFGRYWVVDDATANITFFDITSLIIDAFAMPVLFFIAGYFALPNIRKKGAFLFLKDKFIRLGIPWLIGVLFIAPIINYIYHYKHLGGKTLLGYGQFWLNWMKTAGDFHTGFLYPGIISYNQTAYWFISLLLFFFIIFGIIYALKKRFSPSSAIQEKTNPGEIMLLVVLFAWGLNTIIIAAVAMIPYPYPNPWVGVASVLQFQTWRLPVYIVYFALGIYAFSKNWFVKDNYFPGHPLLWIAICIILCFGYLLIFKSFISNLTSLELRFMSALLGSVVRAIFLIIFTNIAFRYWNRPDKINKTLAANSYNIYLVHLPIVVALQLLLFNLTGTPSLIKFGIVSVVSFLMSYIISKYAIKPHPRLSIAAVVVIFLLMVIFVYPRA